MHQNLSTAIITIITGILGVAVVAVIVGKNAQTSNVISAAGHAFGNDLKIILSPVTTGVSVPGISLPALTSGANGGILS